MVFEGTPQQYSMDGYLKSNLDIAKENIKKDLDMIFVVDGGEGSGKSVLTMQCAFYCDPDPELANRICFTPAQFRQAIMKAEKYQAVIYDEAHSGLNSRAAMTMVNRTLVSMLTEIRQKNLFVFIVLPTFFDVDRYVALWRSRALIHVYFNKGFERGYLAFYNSKSKKLLYLKGKKLYQYGVQKPDFIGRFPNFYPLNESQYRKLKADALHRRERSYEEAETAKLFGQWLWEKLQALDDRLTHSQRMMILDMTEPTYYRRLKQWKEMKAIE